MKFAATALTAFSLLTTTALSHPAIISEKRQGDTSIQCIGNDYETCVSDTFCTATYPDSCYCLNDARRRCATACRVDLARIQLEDCTAPPDEPVPEDSPTAKEQIKMRKCFDSCVSTRRCITSWPEGCFCQNNVKIGCALNCGAAEYINVFLSGELQECGDPEEESPQ